MARITISYRRDDSGVITGRIFDRLVAHYGREAVFRDIDNIPAGVDFRLHIDRVFNASDIVLAVVGPHWIGPSEGQNRLANEADPVRIEIAGALRKGTTLIPVLVLGARMPTVVELPDDLKDFAYRNAVQVDAGQDFDVHMARLIRAIDGFVGPTGAAAKTPQTAANRPASPARRVAPIAALLALILVAAGAGAAWFLRGDVKPAAVAAAPAMPAKPLTEAAAAVPPPPTAETRPQAPAVSTVDAEAVFWQSISTSSNPSDFEEYLRQYPQGRFAGLAQNRLHPPQPAEQKAVAAAPPPAAPPPPRCGGNSDERLLQPVRLLYQAVNNKDIVLYAAQWSEDGVYRDLSSGVVRSKADKVAERRAKFAQWEQVRLTMEHAVVSKRASDSASIEVTYSMTVKSYGRQPFGQRNVREDYVVACGRDGEWLIEQNIDGNTSR